MDYTAIMQSARDFAREHLRECCMEMREWQDTALLRNGRVRELARMLEPIGAQLRIAEGVIQRAAFDHIAQEDTPDAAR